MKPPLPPRGLALGPAGLMRSVSLAPPLLDAHSPLLDGVPWLCWIVVVSSRNLSVSWGF